MDGLSLERWLQTIITLAPPTGTLAAKLADWGTWLFSRPANAELGEWMARRARLRRRRNVFVLEEGGGKGRGGPSWWENQIGVAFAMTPTVEENWFPAHDLTRRRLDTSRRGS